MVRFSALMGRLALLLLCLGLHLAVAQIPEDQVPTWMVGLPKATQDELLPTWLMGHPQQDEMLLTWMPPATPETPKSPETPEEPSQSAAKRHAPQEMAPVTAQAAGEPAYYPVGPQLNVPWSTVVNGGWTVCYSGIYSQKGIPMSTILAQCSGPYLMLAARPPGAPDSPLKLLAAADRASVLYEAGTSPTAGVESHGSWWYYSDNWSWGFSPAGAHAYRYTCDNVNYGSNLDAQSRLCWHTSGGTLQQGWRDGSDLFYYGTNTQHQRFVFQSEGGDSLVLTPEVNGCIEANQPAGAHVHFSAPSNVKGLTCHPLNSGAVFPVGSTKVTCTATDSASGATLQGKITIQVCDTTAPVIELAGPSGPCTTTSDPKGAIVIFTKESAHDKVGFGSFECDHPSGSLFPLGHTTVTCTATDKFGNTATKTIDIQVCPEEING